MIGNQMKLKVMAMLGIAMFLLIMVYAIESDNDVMTFEMENQKENEYSRIHKLERNKTFQFASYYGDHMVLQSSPQKAVIWGYAPSSAVDTKVEIDIIGSTKQTHMTAVREDGKWVIMLYPVGRGGPYTVIAKLISNKLLSGNKISLQDVLFGDIWVCSGQSNMQFSISQVFNASAEIADSIHYPEIRLFIVADKTSEIPLDDLPEDGVFLPWTRPSPAILGGAKFEGFSAVCWLYGKYLYNTLKYPVGLVETSWGGTPIEAWSSPDVLKKCGITEYSGPDFDESKFRFRGMSAPHEHSVLWNAMVHPLLNMTIFGAIWYQGEANINANRDLYNCTFPGMINDWRRKFHAASSTSALFPFGFVQLASYAPDHTKSVGFPDIRWHQTADYGYVPNHKQRNVFMAVAMDLPDFTSPYGSIHPRDKQDVAHRLVLSGLAVAYNQNVSHHGPYPVKMTVMSPCDQDMNENITCIFIDYTVEVEIRSFEGFEVCCAFTEPPVCKPGKSWWLPVTAFYRHKRSGIYSMSCRANNIVGVRYGWRESPCPFKKCSIYGFINQLPMPPFTYSGERFLKKNIGSKDGFVVYMM